MQVIKNPITMTGCNSIWKYELHVGHNHVEIPQGSKILYAREQEDRICIWVVVDALTALTEYKIIHVIGSGFSFPSDQGYFRHIGSAHMYQGKEIYHCFEVTPE
jgi:hypothetical protein